MPRGGVGTHPKALQVGAAGLWQMVKGLNIATKGWEQPVAIITTSCSDHLGCRTSVRMQRPAGSTGFALCGAGLEGKERGLS